ncbi:MAG: glycosyltransferase family 2 protein [Pseudomonas sp.]|nr:glycosyltransferase family 2 protein [Pseudomonas sp.]
MTSSRLVSILIPAYKATYFEAALKSAMRQNHDEVEIIIGDDCPDDSIHAIVERLAPASPWPVRYWRNPQPLGEIGNVSQCLQNARGEYIKFLFDDDLIVPDCTRIMVDVFETTPGLSMVSSRRRRIDEQGQFLEDIQATRLPFGRDVVVHGPELVSFQGQYTLNFIGEPSSVMCRRADLQALLPLGLYSLNGHEIHWVGDLAIYVKLLQGGHLALLDRTLSYFRVSTAQYSHDGRVNPDIARGYHEMFRAQIAASGWLRPSAVNPFVKVADLNRPNQFQDLDLLGSFTGKPTPRPALDPVEAWLHGRQPSQPKREQMDQALRAQQGGPRFLVVVSDLGNQHQALMQSLMSLGHDSLASLRLQVVVLSAAPQLPQDSVEEGLYWLSATPATQGQVLNAVLDRFDFDWLLRIEAGVQFTEDGLWRVAYELLGAQGCRAVYADALQRSAGGALQLVLRPDFNLDLLLSVPHVMAAHWLFSRAALQAVGGFDAQWAQALDLNLITRLIEHGGMQGLGHVDEALLILEAPAPGHDEQEQQVLLGHLHTRGYAQGQVQVARPGQYHLDYGHAAKPLVSIIVPAGRQLPLLQRCVASLLQNTAYGHIELLLLDTAPGASEWLEEVRALGEPRLRVLRMAQQTDVAACNQAALTQARGELVLLLDSRSAAIAPRWLDELLNHAQRPEVGIVGAAWVGPHGQPLGEADWPVAGVLSGIAVDQERKALPLGAMLIKRTLFEQAGGLDTAQATFEQAQSELCTRIVGAGYLAIRAARCTLMRDTE